MRKALHNLMFYSHCKMKRVLLLLLIGCLLVVYCEPSSPAFLQSKKKVVQKALEEAIASDQGNRVTALRNKLADLEEQIKAAESNSTVTKDDDEGFIQNCH